MACNQLRPGLLPQHRYEADPAARKKLFDAEMDLNAEENHSDEMKAAR